MATPSASNREETLGRLHSLTSIVWSLLLASALGTVIAALLRSGLLVLSGEPPNWLGDNSLSSFLLGLVLASAAGAPIALMQWLRIRRWVHEPNRWLFSVSIGSVVYFTTTSQGFYTPQGYFIVGVVAGATSGIAQWLCLRRNKGLQPGFVTFTGLTVGGAAIGLGLYSPWVNYVRPPDDLGGLIHVLPLWAVLHGLASGCLAAIALVVPQIVRKLSGDRWWVFGLTNLVAWVFVSFFMLAATIPYLGFEGFVISNEFHYTPVRQIPRAAVMACLANGVGAAGTLLWAHRYLTRLPRLLPWLAGGSWSVCLLLLRFPVFKTVMEEDRFEHITGWDSALEEILIPLAFAASVLIGQSFLRTSGVQSSLSRSRELTLIGIFALAGTAGGYVCYSNLGYTYSGHLRPDWLLTRAAVVAVPLSLAQWLWIRRKITCSHWVSATIGGVFFLHLVGNVNFSAGGEIGKGVMMMVVAVMIMFVGHFASVHSPSRARHVETG